jgi:putative peptidoglycan lipid II flippase
MNRVVTEETGSHEVVDAIGVAGWTLVSRVTGLLRVAVVGATLGPTLFANIFQATNTVPNIAYNLMAGSLLAPLIVPSLVAALDEGGIDRARRVAQGVIGVVIVGFCAAGVAILALGPAIVHLLTLGVHEHTDSARAMHQSWVLLLLVVPQIALYGIGAVGIAAQNARRHFALAAAAPAVENVGLIATLLIAAKVYGVGLGFRAVTPGYLVLLGGGATASVAAHTALQVLGAARAGMPLWPKWGWRDPAVRDVCRRALPTIGTAMFDACWLFALIVASGTVPGGVVAFQIGLNFYFLPLALSAKSIGTVMLPRLAREAAQRTRESFRATYDRGRSWVWFFAAPASLVFVLLARPIAQTLAFGEMRRAGGLELLAASIAGLGVALIGASTNEFARQACYARHDVAAPLRSGVALLAVTLIGTPIAVTAFSGAAALAALGIVVTIGDLVRATIIDRSARRDTPPTSGWPGRALVRHLGLAAVTIGPAAIVARVVADGAGGRLGALAAVAVGAGGGVLAYLGLQGAFRSGELRVDFRQPARQAARDPQMGAR